MALEIELKLQVESHDVVRERLRELGGLFDGVYLETNCMLDRPDGTLRKLGKGLRIRSMVCEQGQPLPATLTFKGPRQMGTVKTREEIEVEVSDPTSARCMFESLGFICVFEYQKRRERWRMASCRIELDQPPYLGYFVEIEGPDEQAIRAVQRELLLDSLSDVSPSYVHMLLSYCKAHDIVDRKIPLHG